MKKQFKNFAIEIKQKEKKERTFTAVITSEILDRDKEVLLSEGLNYKEFMNNPVVFFNHNYDNPVGKVIKLHKYKNEWKATIKIADRPDNYTDSFFPDYLWAMVEQDVIKGISIGFSVVATRQPTKLDFKLYGNDLRNVITKFELLEVSVAPLQANQNSLIQSVNKGLLTEEQCKKYFDIDIQVSLDTEEEKKEKVVLTATRKKDVANRVKKEILIQLKKRNGELYI